MARDHLETKVFLRAKNQLTLPDALAEKLGVGSGDVLILSIDEIKPDTIRIRPLRKSYAAVAAGVYGRSENVAEYLQSERTAWDT